MISLIIEIIGWTATVFRSLGMLCKSANSVKVFVSVGNFLWMISGILTHNNPLIASNAICLIIMIVDIIKTKYNLKKTNC